MEIHTWIFLHLGSSTRELLVAVKTPKEENEICDKGFDRNSSEFNSPWSTFATSFTVLMAARYVADKNKNFNYSFVTGTISAKIVHNQ